MSAFLSAMAFALRTEGLEMLPYLNALYANHVTLALEQYFIRILLRSPMFSATNRLPLLLIVNDETAALKSTFTFGRCRPVRWVDRTEHLEGGLISYR